MAIDDNPLTVFNKQLENDELLKPVGASALELAGKAAQVPGLQLVLEPLSKGLELVSKCLSLGLPTVEDNLKLLGQLVEGELIKIDEKLANVGKDVGSFRATVESQAFVDYLATGVLQTQRTKQKKKLRRIALLIANGAAENDLNLESGDDMMRAAVELRDSDYLLLRDLNEMETQSRGNFSVPSNDGLLWQWWQDYWANVFPNKYPEWEPRKTATGFERLAAQGLIYGARITAMAASPVPMNYWISEEGVKFLRRVQETAGEVS